VIPLSLVAAGAIALAAGWLLLRGSGSRVRVGRILAATPVVPVARAVAMAADGSARYVAVEGRLDAAEPWEDESHQPLVFQRSRLELRQGARWVTFEDQRRVVPFELSEGLDRIAIDGDALGEGLIVVHRESVGTAADAPDRVPEGTAPSTPVRLVVERLTAVDQARVLGTPVVDPELGPIMRPGRGRPLILTTLEPAEAMRLLAYGRHTTMRVVAILMVAGAASLAVGILWALVDALA
jgi:hypothetical protein